MKKNKSQFIKLSSLLLCLNTFSFVGAQEEPSDDSVEAEYSNRMLIVGKKNDLNTEAGSATIIDEAELEKFEFDDIHRILAQVPGINIRQEDGFGLRPNIGFRGVTPERSKKINILEDGVLIGPAPYSAPAAYYFPMVSRMTSVEVFKGPSAILYGPNTVAGTLNLQTRQVSDQDEGLLDVSFANDGYQKVHGYGIENFGNFGVLVEGLFTESDGFKKLDGGGETGFEKNDLTTKIRFKREGKNYDEVYELKLSYADEISNETYLGLTDEDFKLSPFRRYAATQLGLMDWTHQQFQFNHFLSGDGFDVTTRVYRNNFERAWRKVNNFRQTGIAATQRSLQEILQSPETGINAIYYQILTGEKDSEELYEQLLIGTNDRSFYSQGVQSDLRKQVSWGDYLHHLKAGIRYHEDQIERNHTEDSFNMINAMLVATGAATNTTTANTENSKVWSLYLQDTLKLGQWEISAGMRAEYINAYYQNDKPGFEEDWIKKSSTIWLPGASVFYSLDENSGLFAGLHRGFIPTSPKQASDIQIEESLNLELGYRYSEQMTKLELVGFISDFKNLKESCTASTSSNCISMMDQEFNAGEVNVFGVEANWAHRIDLNDSIELPWSIVYTYTNAEFQQTFNSDFELWGNVEAGDPVPYLPEQQLTLSFGLEGNSWQTSLLFHYTDEMNEAAGTGVDLSGVKTDDYWNVDFSAVYDFDRLGSVYFKVDNLTDEINIISRRPFGARPGKPRQIYLGYKYRW